MAIKKLIVPTRMKLGEMLILKGTLTPERLYDMLQIQKQTGDSLGNILTRTF